LLSAERGSTELALAIVDRQRGLTPAKALESPQLSALSRHAPGDAAEALGNLLIFTSAQFNVPRNLSDVQVALLVNDLLARYWHWRFDEFVYLCREAIAGRWGCHYATVDAPTVHSWCVAYAEVRDAEVEHAAEQQRLATQRAERQVGPSRADDEQAFRRHLESLSDEQLQQGIAYYQHYADAPHAALRVELAAEVLLDRKRLYLLQSVLEQPTDQQGCVHYEEASEDAYRRHRAAWVAQGGSVIGAEHPMPALEQANEEAA